LKEKYFNVDTIEIQIHMIVMKWTHMTSDLMEMYRLISKSRNSLCTITGNQLLAEILNGDKHNKKDTRFIKTIKDCTNRLKV